MGTCASSGAGAGLHALGAARRSLRAMILSSAAYLVCSLVGAVAGGAVGTMRGTAVATWMAALLWWWQLRAALREACEVPARDQSRSRRLAPRPRGFTWARFRGRHGSRHESSAMTIVSAERLAPDATGRDPENVAVATAPRPSPTDDLPSAGGRSLAGLVDVSVQGQLPRVAELTRTHWARPRWRTGTLVPMGSVTTMSRATRMGRWRLRCRQAGGGWWSARRRPARPVLLLRY